MPQMRLSAEKRMRKHLLEQLKARKVLGARIAQGYKTKKDLQELNLAPQVFMFKNLFSGQVMYSQVPAYHQDQINASFTRPNWENRKPARRNDHWRLMAVASFANYEYAVAAYNGLLKLRQVRDVHKASEAKSMRRKNEDGNTWYSGQYRPTHQQEAAADLAHVIDEFELENTKIAWENIWRKGDDSHWRMDLIEHDTLPAFTPKFQSVVLDEMRKKGLDFVKELRSTAAEAPQATEAQADATA
ncbi:uncharacterized protein CXQ87_001966 [Candidozyma duobushaemuli]|uniref:Large ribosomal subunit protein mL67 n=2 Tax=Candidozyma TaxID=3303203 RepID=A0ABX8I5K0_9ASCO|nr:uncharacterized protein CXQ87_001966 [[Candida] duobushaemulonis]PVH13848.1 hypothetical protein CXQ87_001966 [[Candida] duobushaemulonis]QWU87925.1 hypothetical protein CA3LBN_002190 [[Candida] haemuloni]